MESAANLIGRAVISRNKLNKTNQKEKWRMWSMTARLGNEGKDREDLRLRKLRSVGVRDVEHSSCQRYILGYHLDVLHTLVDRHIRTSIF